MVYLVASKCIYVHFSTYLIDVFIYVFYLNMPRIVELTFKK